MMTVSVFRGRLPRFGRRRSYAGFIGLLGLTTLAGQSIAKGDKMSALATDFAKSSLSSALVRNPSKVCGKLLTEN